MKPKDIKTEQDRLDYVTCRQLRHKYGITIEQYNQRFNEQNGCCAICKKHQGEFKRRLHIDHNHETGELRSLLCPNCNTVIGKVGESVELLGKIAEYLEIWSVR